MKDSYENVSARCCHTDRLCGLVVKSSWLQIQRSWFDSRLYQTFWEIVGLERGPLSLVSTIEELLGRKSRGSGPESPEYAVRIRHPDHVAPSIHESWHQLRQQAAVVGSV
jgi:hypothetical protein